MNHELLRYKAYGGILMKILVVGGGGREHAIIWKLAQNPTIKKIYCAPGNGGIADLAECVPINAMDIEGIVNFSKEKQLDLVVVSPDDPLAAGMVDALQKAGIRAFGPVADAAVIESSKAFSKELMKKYGIPSAEYEIFVDCDKALEYLKNSKYPIVIKADGLALGKGVIIAADYKQASEAVLSMMKDKVFGKAGEKIVIEEYLEGPEVSILTFTDGKTIVPMVSSQDHKRALDNNMGPNTGGMGTFSPSRIYTPEIADYCMKNIFKPTIEAMNKENRTFKGVLYFGLMLTKNGPKVLEYNARFGDPETQVVLPKLKTDLLDIFNAVIDEKLEDINIEWNDSAVVCVIAASGGYPGKYTTGYEITGLDKLQNKDDIFVFHAGTKKENGKVVTSGGRVLGVTAMAENIDNARMKAYSAIKEISFKDMHYRTDIGIK